MPSVFPPPKSNPITAMGGRIAEFFYSWVVAISNSNNSQDESIADHETRIATLETIQAVTAPILLNSWVNFGDPYETAGYYKDPSGRVHIRGLIKSGTTTPGTQLFNLPSGFRPNKRQIFATITAGTVFSNDPGRVDIEPDGDVLLMQGNNGYLSLDGISFRAE